MGFRSLGILALRLAVAVQHLSQRAIDDPSFWGKSSRDCQIRLGYSTLGEHCLGLNQGFLIQSEKEGP